MTGRGAKTTTPLFERIAPNVADLAAEGVARNEIARRLDCSPATVTKAARMAGVAFDGTATEAATVANVARSTASRAELADRSAGLADKAGRRLAMELDAEVLDPVAVRTLATAFGVAVDKLVVLAASLPDTAEASTKGALDALMGAILSRATSTTTTDELENP